MFIEGQIVQNAVPQSSNDYLPVTSSDNTNYSCSNVNGIFILNSNELNGLNANTKITFCRIYFLVYTSNVRFALHGFLHFFSFTLNK